MGIFSNSIKCDGHAALPKYVFVLSLENRSFDHLFGRSAIKGKDVSTGQTRFVNGVLTKDSTDPNSIDQQWKNTYEGTDYHIPTISPPWRMPSDPKHEYEHILCQSCGPQAVKDLFAAFLPR